MQDLKETGQRIPFGRFLHRGGPNVIERKHGFPAEPVPVSAYAGSSENLKDLKELRCDGAPRTSKGCGSCGG